MYVHVMNTMTYQSGVQAAHSYCTTQLSSLLKWIERHLPNTIKKIPSKARQYRPVNNDTLVFTPQAGWQAEGGFMTTYIVPR